MSRIHYDLCARDRVLTLGRATQIMGIVNCTPDSFSGDGKLNPAACFKLAQQLVREGANIIDVGGESTRPGAKPVAADEEIKRIIPVIKQLADKTKIIISVDTSKTEVACAALDAGAAIVNNVRGTNSSASFLKMVRDYQAAIVLMHTRGTPATMQSKAKYKNVALEVIEELQISIEKCLAIGIKKERIIIDPGIGFAKNSEHNLGLLQKLNRLNVLKCPILIGTSRKSFIGQLLGTDVKGRLMGTAATVVAAVLQGAHIVRVHDVAPIKESLIITDAILDART